MGMSIDEVIKRFQSNAEYETIKKGADKDNINPDHYKSSTSLECIEAMEMVFSKKAVIDFCMCNAWKYIWRWKHKNGQEDLKKADWYIVKAKELIGTDHSYHTSAVNLGVINRMRNYISEHKEETND